MNVRLWAFLICGALGGLGVPFLIASNLQLGNYAKSPQVVELMLGRTALVGGGRAKITYLGGDSGRAVEVRCSKEERLLEDT